MTMALSLQPAHTSFVTYSHCVEIESDPRLTILEHHPEPDRYILSPPFQRHDGGVAVTQEGA